jgi:hypothetical protein
VTDFVAQDLQTRFDVASLDLEHLRQFQLRKAGMRQIVRDGDAWDVVRGEPFIGQPVVRPEDQRAGVELGADLRDTLFEIGAFNRQAEIADARLEQLLVGP